MNSFRILSIPIHPLALAFGALAVFLVLFGGPPGFRDGVHFYGPLFEYLRQELAAGRLPLWNPYENLGQPLAASPTTMFFYPGTIPVLGAAILTGCDSLPAYTAFAGAHLFLALFFAYRLIRSFGCGREAAALAALCYTLGGNVLYQWNNLPFLVGAAWFPEALRLADRTVRRGGIRNTVFFGAVLALTILGGDPQAACHAIIASFVLLCFFSWKQGRFFRRAGWLVLAGAFAFLLSAVQILPAVELGFLSDRSLDMHRLGVYRFSVPPWRLTEFFWPGAGGWQFPENARWFSALPWDYDIWVPSFYMGLPTGLLAIFTFLLRTRSPRWKTVKFLAVLFLLGSLGNWCFVYPLLDRLPGYGLFRYPAKLLTVASLMLALLAARGVDRIQWDKMFRRRFKSVFCGYLLPAVFVSIIAVGRFDLFPPVPNCVLFGPFDAQAARSGLVFSAVSVGLVVLAATLLRWNPKALIVLAALDLATANAWMLTTLPADRQRAVPLLPNEMESIAPVRIYRFPIWYPPEFEKTSSKNRLVEAADWDRRSFYHRYPLPWRINMMDVRGTLIAKTYYPLAGRLRKELSEEGDFEKHLARLGVCFVVAPAEAKLDALRLFPDVEPPTDVSFWKIRDPAPREFVRYEPNRIVWDVALAEAKTVVLTEQYWPGWRAFLDDGTEIPVRPVDDVFRSLDLPRGKHRVTMIYDPPLLKLGGALSLLGIVLTAVAIPFFSPGRKRSVEKEFVQ